MEENYDEIIDNLTKQVNHVTNSNGVEKTINTTTSINILPSNKNNKLKLILLSGIPIFIILFLIVSKSSLLFNKKKEEDKDGKEGKEVKKISYVKLLILIIFIIIVEVIINVYLTKRNQSLTLIK